MYIKKRDAMKIYYYLIAVGGKVSQAGMEKFMEIGTGTDSFFMDYKDEVVEECSRQVERALNGSEYDEAIREGVDEALSESSSLFWLPFESIPASAVLWNLLCIAMSNRLRAAQNQAKPD